MIAFSATIPAQLAFRPLASAPLASGLFDPAIALARLAGGWGALAAAVGALLLVLLPVHAEWRRRRKLWLVAPERLLDDPPAVPGPRTAGVVLAAFAGALALAGENRWQDPLTAWIAAIAVFTANHLRWSSALALFGFALLAVGIARAAHAWLPGFGLNTGFALALSALYFLWLSRFWDQQLLAAQAPPGAAPDERDGQAWTTTGRLVPVARQAAYLVLLLATAVLLAQLIDPRVPTSIVSVALTTILFLAAALRCAGTPRRRDGALAIVVGAAAVACAGLSAVVGLTSRT